MSQPDRAEVFESIFSVIDALVYRCRNDSDYTMEYLDGAVRSISGYSRDDLLGNSRVSWVGITHPDDVERVFGIVDEAIARGVPWDVDYRIVRADGRAAWVRERGCAVMEEGELAYLQGLIVDAGAEVELRDQMAGILETSKAANDEILDLAKNILKSVEILSILSVNARIEAARSGDAGRGFAVVAEEISTLAQENGKWAQMIAQKMDGAEAANRSAA
ncbi:MAG: PAS domain-containing protein [Pseudomonadota bacterium]